jgi:hypothetical protein
MLKGTILISPEDKNNFFAFFVKSQIVDNRPSKQDDSIADERLIMICQNNSGEFSITSPAKFIDLHPPTQFTKPIETPLVINQEEVVHWSFNHITLQQFEDTKNLVEKIVPTVNLILKLPLLKLSWMYKLRFKNSKPSLC